MKDEHLEIDEPWQFGDEQMDERQSWLVSFDTDRIKEYLFATNKLKEIRGASYLLRELDEKRNNKEWIEGLDLKTDLIYSAGGSALFLVPDESQAKELIKRVSKSFRAETINATITGVSLPPTDSEGNFGKRMRDASIQLRRAKDAKADLISLPSEPYLQLCQSCGANPAHIIFTGGNRSEKLCKSCEKKRIKGERSKLYEEFCSYIQEVDGKEHPWANDTMPDDLNQIGYVSTPPNYIGFIALDGNRMGDLLVKLREQDNYRKFSEDIERLVRSQTFDALRRYGVPRNHSKFVDKLVAPFEVVLIGGDDVLLITAADIAINVALEIAEGFERNSPEILKDAGLSQERKKLTMAGGVVLAHADFPIPALHRLSESLQVSAKRFCAEEGYNSGAIDFVVVSSSDLDLDVLRRDIHCRPYALDKLRVLVEYRAKFKEADFPTTQLQTMYRALFTNKVNAQLASISALGCLARKTNDMKKYKLLREFFEKFDVSLELPPWVVDKNISPLADLVELYPFICEEKDYGKETY